MTGSMAEFELSLLRQRSLEAIRQKARRAELRFPLPLGFRWMPNGKIEMEPDLRIHQALHLTFRKMTELGSVRQVQLWFHRENISLLPVLVQNEGEQQLIRKLAVYGRILGILTNPLYAGAYAFGRRETRTRIIDGRARKTEGHSKPLSEWTVLIRDHHPGYISWEQYERNQAMIAANTHMKSRMGPKVGRGGRVLLTGLLRCRRYGRMLNVEYTGHDRKGRYRCRGAQMSRGEDWCISFGAWRPDQAVAQEVLEAIGGNAVEAALEAAEPMRVQREARRRAAEMELEQARYEPRLAPL